MDEQRETAVPFDFESLVRQAIGTQQPFYNALLNQMSSIEGRQEAQARTMMEVRDRVNQLWNQEHHRTVSELASRIKQLEDEQQQRRGVINAAEWMPKVLRWLATIIVIVFLALKFDIKLPS